MHKVIKLTLLPIAIMFFATGCWDRHELTDRAFVVATGLDEGPDGSIVESVQMAVPSQMGDSPGAGKQKEPFVVMQATGKTVLEPQTTFKQSCPETCLRDIDMPSTSDKVWLSAG